MGVAGCGKSSAGQAVADALGLPLIEGDDFHGPANQAKMSAGVALTDEDREGWLAALAAQLAARPAGVVLTCSALKRAYRDRLRAAQPRLRFVHLVIDEQTALSRVVARAGRHFFGPELVSSQFRTLEDPAGEPGVLALDATLPLADIAAATARWVSTGDTP
ncbi:MAG: gluconokinase [Burkholderiales bacterium]|nr:gluconokinase [Burkholderiales bacterium]